MKDEWLETVLFGFIIGVLVTAFVACIIFI